MFFLCLLIVAERFHEWPHLGTPITTLAGVPLTLVKFIGIATIGDALAAATPDDAAPRLRAKLGTLFALFAAIPIIATVSANDPFPSNAVSYFISIGLMMFAARRLLSTYPRMRVVIRTLVAVVGFSTFWSFKQRFVEHRLEYFVWGVSEDSNYEALSVLVIVPLALWLARWDEERRWRRIGALSTVAMVGTVILTESRGGLMGLGVVCLSELFGRRKRTYKFILVCGICIALLLAPSNLWRRMKSIQITGEAVNEAAESTEVRWQVLLAGVSMIRAHPIFGVGLDLYKRLSVRYNPRLQASGGNIAHNTYMQIGAEGGLVALSLFVSLMLVALRDCSVVSKSTAPDELRDLAGALRTTILAYSVAALFLSASYQVFYWLVVVMSENLRDLSFAKELGKKRRRLQQPKPINEELSVLAENCKTSNDCI